MKKYRFVLKDFQAIHQADIDLNGITVISGENGSGKTTIGKWLYYLVEMASHFESYVFDEYIHALKIELRTLFYNSPAYSIRNLIYEIEDKLEQLDPYRPSSVEISMSLFKEGVTSILENVKLMCDESEKNIRKSRMLTSFFLQYGINTNNIDVLEQQILAKAQTAQNKYIEEINKRSFKKAQQLFLQVFPNKGKIPSSIQLIEDETKLVERGFLYRTVGLHRVIYVDTPMALTMDDNDNYFWKVLRRRLIMKAQYDYANNNKEELIHYVQQVIAGDVNVEKGNLNEEELHYQRNDNLNIEIQEAATGLKSFAYILRLLKNGYLDDKTLLIIDEPEAHLHPQWIVEFARVLVRLHTMLGVRVLINSHNPDMVAAMQTIAQKEGALDRTTFYLAERINNTWQYDYRSLGTDIADIFTSFNIAITRMQEYGADID